MDPQTAQPVPQQTSGSKTPIVLLIILVVALVAVGVFFLLRGQQTKGPTEEVVTGLARESITIAQPIALSGVFPDSVPEFNDVVFNNNIFDGLGRIVAGEVKPALATSWTNPDRTTWRFKLRKGVKFHNGDAFTAADVKFSIDMALEEEWPNVLNLSTVKSVEVVDDSTVDVKTSAPDPVLLNRLVFAFIVSEKQFKERGKDPAVGTGPYKFVSLDKKKAVLEANQSYYLDRPKVKKIVYKFFPEDVTDKQLIEALRKGEVDLIKLTDEDLSKTIKTGFQVKSLADPFIAFLWLDTARNKSPYVDKSPNPLKNKLVRQAIYKAINVGNVIKEATLSAAPASQYVTDAIFGYNPDINRPDPNIEEAKKLMGQANVADGFNITLDFPAFRAAEGKAIAKGLAKINIKAKVNPLTKEEGFEKLFVKNDTSAFILDYGAETYDAGEIFTGVLHSRSGTFGSTNLTGYSNSEIDKLAEEIASTFDSKIRLTKLQEAMMKAIGEVPVIPLYSQKFFYVVRDKFDWTPTAFGAIYTNEISGRQVVIQ